MATDDQQLMTTVSANRFALLENLAAAVAEDDEDTVGELLQQLNHDPMEVIRRERDEAVSERNQLRRELDSLKTWREQILPALTTPTTLDFAINEAQRAVGNLKTVRALFEPGAKPPLAKKK